MNLTEEEMENAAPFYFVLRNFATQLRLAREALGLTIQDVAERCGYSPTLLARLEDGLETNPSWKTLGEYAKAVECHPSLTLEKT